MAEHTPTPWSAESEKGIWWVAGGEFPVTVAAEADAKLIVEAVNSHAELTAQVEALRADVWRCRLALNHANPFIGVRVDHVKMLESDHDGNVSEVELDGDEVRAEVVTALVDTRGTGKGAFPPDMLCECGCLGFGHRTKWGETFEGTQCANPEHGGHKFAPAVAAPR